MVGYNYDDVGNRTHLTYPNGQVVTYTYDMGNRLETVTDWHNGQFGYNYDNGNRLLSLTLPNNVTSSYTYDEAGRLTLLSHKTPTEALASYAYSLDNVGNRTILTETLLALQPISTGAYLESEGLVVIEAENSQTIAGSSHAWLTATTRSGYTGTAYLKVLPDTDKLYQTDEITSSPTAQYPVYFTTPGTYTVWLRGYAGNAAGDSAYMILNEEMIDMTGFTPNSWAWANQTTSGETTQLAVGASGLYTLNLRMREDGLRIDRLLLTTDTTYLPLDFGPPESERLTDTTHLEFVVDRVIDYDYDNLYRLTEANYSTGELYEYAYGPSRQSAAADHRWRYHRLSVRRSEPARSSGRAELYFR